MKNEKNKHTHTHTYNTYTYTHLKDAIMIKWERGKIFSKEAVAMFHGLIKGQKKAKCLTVEKTPTSIPKPKPLNTVALLLSVFLQNSNKQIQTY